MHKEKRPTLIDLLSHRIPHVSEEVQKNIEEKREFYDQIDPEKFDPADYALSIEEFKRKYNL